MNGYIISLSIAAILLITLYFVAEDCYGDLVKQQQPDGFLKLLRAIEIRESGSRADAVGDDGAAVGSFQLHKIYVRDVNRILGYKAYTYFDRWNRQKSCSMASTYLLYYGKGLTLEQIARNHNGGGPDGWKKKCTQSYGKAVMQIYKEL